MRFFRSLAAVALLAVCAVVRGDVDVAAPKDYEILSTYVAVPSPAA
jgi:hypothetical protein